MNTYQGITLMDIRDTDFEELGGHNKETIHTFFKIDYLKNHILLHQMQNGTTDYG